MKKEIIYFTSGFGLMLALGSFLHLLTFKTPTCELNIKD
jgi:hypothetical protein